MKIAFLNFYSGFVARGGETYVHELANHLSKNNKVVVFQAGPKTKANYETKIIGKFKETIWLSSLPTTHVLRRLFLDKYKLRELLFTIKLIPNLWRLKPNIIITLNSGWQVFLISIYCRFTRTKLVVAGQSGPGWDDRWNLLMKPDLFVALTNYQLAWAKQATIWRQAFALIPNGVDLVRFSPQGEKANLKLNKPIVMMVAASTPDKRVEEGIRAVAGLKSGSMLLIGQGPLDKRINNLGYQSLGDNRFLHLSIKHEDIPRYYRAVDLFTLCSVSSEAFGIVYLEAMASGLGCVATDGASRHEIIGDAGIFVKDPGNTKEYSSALEKMIILSSQAKSRDLSLAQAAKFSWDKITESYQKELDSLCH